MFCGRALDRTVTPRTALQILAHVGRVTRITVVEPCRSVFVLPFVVGLEGQEAPNSACHTRDTLPRLKARASHPVVAGQVNPEGWESKVCWTVSQWLCHEAITRTPEGASSYLISYRLSAWSAYFLISALNRGEHRVNRQFSTHSV